VKGQRADTVGGNQILKDSPQFQTTSRSQSRLGASKVNEPASSAYLIGEINTFIAIRDHLLTDAEASKTREQISRASLANQAVETCLRSPRHPYEAQFLPEADAIRERQRCQVAKSRIAKLRASTVSHNTATGSET
jgi:hypothetical protein